MPNIKSAKKRVLVNQTKAARNKALKSNLKTMMKTANQAVEAKADNMDAAVANAVKTIDMACSKGLIHKNNAARKKSKLVSKLNAPSVIEFCKKTGLQPLGLFFFCFWILLFVESIKNIPFRQKESAWKESLSKRCFYFTELSFGLFFLGCFHFCLIVLAVVSLQVHFLDLADQRVTGVAAGALVVEGVPGHFVQGGQEVLFLDAVVGDGLLHPNRFLQFFNLGNELL